MRRWTKILGIVLGVVMLASVIGAGVVFAADPPPANQPTSGNIFLDKLAARLKVSADYLKAAITGARQDTLNDLQAQGRITEQQKQTMQERLKARSDAGSGLGMMGRGFRVCGPRGGAWGQQPAPAAPKATT